MSVHESIQLLPPDVAAKIAAGEVVERPANAVKELIENSLDAGASDVRIEIREGGRRLLRVGDNGRGMRADEVPLAFLRHATSKLRTAADLEAIGTFGFRGEALYSIAAVSYTTLLTRHRDEEFGTQLRLEAGELRAQGRAGAPVGTVVTVEQLFFNVPARRKFLRAPVTEAGQIAAVVQRYALAYPECRFSFQSDDRLVFQSSGSGDLLDVLAQVYGPEAARRMVPLADDGTETTPEASLADDIDFQEGVPQQRAAPSSTPLHITGYAALPTLTRANRSGIQLFVNRRAVEDRSLTHAVVQAYHTLLPVGRYPLAVVLVELDPAEVDVNVHPQKLQVRFVEERRVFHAVQKAVRTALLDKLGVPSLEIGAPDTTAASPAPGWSGGAWGGWESEAWAARRENILGAGQQRAFELPPAHPAPEAPAPPAAYAPEPPTPNGLPPLRVVGQVGATYIVAEGPQGMFLIDQHAAHERILYEQFMERRWGMVDGEAARQHLLAPVTIHAGSEEAGLVARHLTELERAGFELEPFGGDSFLVRAVPSVLAGEDPAASLIDIATSMSGGRNLVGEEFEAQLVKMVCKRAAIKAGQLLSDIEMQELLRQLEECRSPRTCPHGRPTMIQLSAGELEKAFGRI